MKRIVVEMEDEAVQLLDEAAKQEGRTRSAIMRRALTVYIHLPSGAFGSRILTIAEPAKGEPNKIVLL